MTHQEILQSALSFGMEHKPKVGGFPFLAEVLRQAGVKKNIWSLPSLQSLYLMDMSSIVIQGSPLIHGMSEISPFDEPALIRALRIDQAGGSTFPEFLESAWKAGVTSYIVNFEERTVRYFWVNGESYIESYPQVEVST